MRVAAERMSSTGTRQRRQSQLELIGFGVFLLLAFVAVGFLAVPLGAGRSKVSAPPLLVAQGALLVVVVPVVTMLQERRGWRLADLGLVAPRQGWGRGCAIGAGFGVAIKAATIPVALLALALGVRPDRPAFEMDGAFDLLLFVLGGCGAAVFEEIVFRGYLRDRIARAYGWGRNGWQTGVVTSLAFGLGHVGGGLLGIVTTGFVGMLLFLMVCSPRLNLVHCIVAHATFNTTAFLCLGAMGR